MYILIFLYGLLIGSFLNVCIYRVPREESIVFPSSHCPNCSTKLKWYDNIPVVSYLALMGKCRYCKNEISIQYPMVELLNGILYIIIYSNYGLILEFFFYAIIFSILLIITFVDLQHMIIPDIFIISVVISTILYKIFSYILYKNSPDLINSFGGLILSGFLFIVIILVSKGGMGGGDVTLIGSLGFILGIKSIFLTIFLSFVFGAIISILLLGLKIKGRKDPIPFGPFIILGFFITVLWGETLINFYKSTFLI